MLGIGRLNITEEGYGFVRQDEPTSGPEVVYISKLFIQRYNLQTGDRVSGQIRAPKENEKYYSFTLVEEVNGSVVK